MDLARFAPLLAARLAPADSPRDSADFLLALLHHLAAGEPASTGALAQALRWPLAHVERAIARAAGLERDEHGNVTGYALTLHKTPYEFALGGRTLYTWCAFDTLFFPALLGCTAQVTSRCATSGAAIHLTVTPDAIRDAHPKEAVVSMVLPAETEDVRRGFCNRVRFFASLQAGHAWAAAHPGVEPMAVADVFALARTTAQWIRAQASLAWASDPATRV